MDPRSLLLDRGDAVVSAGWRSCVGSGECLLSVTSRELVIGQSPSDRRWPWSVSARMLYVPRGSVEDAVVRSKTVLMRSAGTDVRIVFRSRRAAAVASSWLSWVLSDHGRLGSAGPPRARSRRVLLLSLLCRQRPPVRAVRRVRAIAPASSLSRVRR
jgi:hypothetical protein